MARSSALALSMLLVLAGAPVAFADGLQLKLKPESPTVKQGEPARVRLQVTARSNVQLSGAPVFVVDNGSGTHEVPPADVKGVEANGSRVTPDRPLKTVYEITLAGPGTYTVRARYALSGGVAESNKVTVVVEPAAVAGSR